MAITIGSGIQIGGGISFDVGTGTSGGGGGGGGGENYWISTYGDVGFISEEYGSSITFDSTGNIFVIGGTDPYPLVVKYDTNGNIIWQKAIGDLTPPAFGQDITIDATGNLITFVGSNVAYPFTDTTELIKFDPNGNLLWATHINRISTEGIVSYGVAVDTTGNIIVGGSDKDYTGAATIWQIPVLFKFDTNGALIWQLRLDNMPIQFISGGEFPNYTYGGYGISIYQVKTDSLDNIYMVGVMSDFFGFAPPDTSRSCALLFKFDSSGVLLWQRAIDCTQDPNNLLQIDCNSLAIDSQDNIYISGIVTYASFAYYSYLAKFNSAGNLIWDVNLNLQPPAGSIHTADLDIDSNDNVYLILQNGTGPLGEDPLIVKYDSSGSLVWQRKFGTSNDEYTWYSRGHNCISVYQNSFAVTATTYYNNNYGDIVVAKLPTNGSLTGNIDQWYYYETNYSSSTFNFVANTSRDYTTNTISHTTSTVSLTLSTIENFTNNLVSYGTIL